MLLAIPQKEGNIWAEWGWLKEQKEGIKTNEKKETKRACLIQTKKGRAGMKRIKEGMGLQLTVWLKGLRRNCKRG